LPYLLGNSRTSRSSIQVFYHESSKNARSSSIKIPVLSKLPKKVYNQLRREQARGYIFTGRMNDGETIYSQ
jgi:hypothetical protein